jgi:hypothetical protein
MRRDSVLKRIIFLIRKGPGNNNTEFAREHQPAANTKVTHRGEPTDGEDPGQAGQDVYSKQERLEESE